MVFSQFFEIMLQFSLMGKRDHKKSDVLKFKEFLLNSVFAPLKHHLRLKKGEEESKPHKVRILKMLLKLNTV
jgi:hypothetical protein